MEIAISGATGFIGRRLVQRILDEGQDRVLALSRDSFRARDLLPPGVEVISWDPLAGAPPVEILERAGAVVHLGGESVAQRWNETVKARIRESRIASTRHLVEGMVRSQNRPGVFLCASAIGYYGPRGDEPLDESASPGGDFLAGVCRDWESEAARAREAGPRTVQLRTGIVLGPGGGALQKMLRPFKMFIGGPLGDGSQRMSWIHLDDLVDLILHVLRVENLEGPVNATAPVPVTNRDFARLLGRVLRRPGRFPSPPAFILRLALGEFADILLTGQRVLPQKAKEGGFQFRFPELEPALKDILSA